MNIPDLFAVLPDDRAERWRRIVSFLSTWHRELTAADGVEAMELDAAERRLGVRLPAAPREAYGNFGRMEEIVDYEILLDPRELWLHDGLLVVIKHTSRDGR